MENYLSLLKIPFYQGHCPCFLTCFRVVQTDRYAEYPKLKELVERKDGLIAARATAPTFLKVLVLSTLLPPPSVGTFTTC